jgi:TrmH family RNA methyltransferase
MPAITSLQNPHVKAIVRLRQDSRFRKKEGLMLVEGFYELQVALEAGLQPLELYLCEELSAEYLEPCLINPIPVTRAVFEKMSHRENPDGWLALIATPQRTLDSISLQGSAFLILAESVEKPGNLGAILRTADAAGADGLIVCDRRTDVYNPNVVRASRGTLFTVPVVETENRTAMAWLTNHGIGILAASPHAELIYSQVDLTKPVCIAVGTEAEGLSDFWLAAAAVQVRIPMQGKVNSLNVSTSTAIIAYELVRQRSHQRVERTL